MTEVVSSLREFDRQVDNLLQMGYPQTAGLSPAAFMALLAPLRPRADGPGTQEEANMEVGHLPFVIVVKSSLVPASKAMSLVERAGAHGVTKMYPRQPEDFSAIVGVVLPAATAYLLVDIDRGRETVNVPPNDALAMITAANRSPLTIDEGIATVTHYPAFLQKNNCYSLLASRSTDQRVPAIWISEGRPRLGWCWAGNPHSWLGSASCRSRIGPLHRA